jgi:hypothetical protein
VRYVGALIAILVVPSSAAASDILDLNAQNVRLQAASDRAVVRYTVDGHAKRVVLSGAVDANAPSRTEPQVTFRRDYSPRALQGRFPNECEPYDGPPLVDLVTACKVSDGSYWAIQAWQRLLPMRGVAAFLPNQDALEFHVSHWSGPTALLEVSPNWTYGGASQGLFGRLTYRGQPVFGYTTPSPTRRGDTYARYVYIDTRNSVYGPGWKHDAGKVLHVGNGAFCYSFVPQKPPAGYPDQTVRGPAVGDRHRVTVMGPGVTPDVAWEGPSLGAYDSAQDAVFNRAFDRLVGSGDRVCARER